MVAGGVMRTDFESEAELLSHIERSKRDWHARQAALPLKKKMRIFLELQKAAYPILKARRKLQWWEKPWDLEP
jgi:hypothetical protein